MDSKGDESTPNIVPEKRKDKDACLRELGYAMIYMKYLHPDWTDSDSGKDQRKRVKRLMLEAAVNWHREPAWWEHFYDRIIDEIENMC